MVSFPNAKINLGLNIIRKRADGYHDLETVFYPVALKDALEIVPRTKGTDNNFFSSGLPIAGVPGDNLCLKAYHLLKKDFPDLPAIDMHLHKTIPMGAGLGGGSADAAFALRMLNQLCSLDLSTTALKTYALELGSDCPFFIDNTPCWATGRGENLTPLEIDLTPYRLLLVNPGIHVSTASAFAGIRPVEPAQSIKAIIQLPVNEWKDLLVNDFENTVFAQFPAIGQVKENMYREGALYASMTGSGSTVYGLFDKHHPLTFAGKASFQVFTLG